MSHRISGHVTEKTSLSPNDVLYVALNVGRVVSGMRQLALRNLAPTSTWPKCDYCFESGEQPVRCDYGTRWAYHEACYPEALRDAPIVASQPPFTRWLTMEQWGVISQALKRQGVNLNSMIARPDGWTSDSLVEQWEMARMLFEVEYLRVTQGGIHVDSYLSRCAV